MINTNTKTFDEQREAAWNDITKNAARWRAKADEKIAAIPADFPDEIREALTMAVDLAAMSAFAKELRLALSMAKVGLMEALAGTSPEEVN